MEQLKSCPFCGGKGVLCHVEKKYYEGQKYFSMASSSYYAYCEDCGIKTKETHDEQQIIAAWNKRPV